MINNSFELKYIPDQVINLIENDLLGTSVYVEILEKIIKDSDTPHTIGLLGSWGSGKSSIIKTLQEKLNNDNSGKIKVFIYDAWKYTKDDFRRTFILELKKFFHLPTTKEEELFYKDKIEDVRYKPKIDIYSILILVIVLVLSFIGGYFYLNLKTVQNFLGSLTYAGLVSFLFSFFRQAIINHRIAITTSKLFAPEKFEEIFKETVKIQCKEQDKRKLVIAIDNIDRCHKEQTFEILLTIKNFLENEGIIFIIPVDEKGLKKFLEINDKDANEFLRKIFNTTVHLKNFSDTELYDFGLKILNKYGIDFPKKENVISLVCQEFSKNPRRIIQFLNTLQMEYQLAKIQEEKGLIPRGAITKNIEMLVKILIIREEYPEIFEKISDNKGLLKEIHEVIRAGGFSKTEDGAWEWRINQLDNMKLTEEQYRFFLRTLNIEMDKTDLEPFFLNKDVFKEVPDEIYHEIISQNWEKLKEALKKNNISFETLISFVDKQTNEDIIKRKLYDTSGFNLASLFFKIVADSEYRDKISRLPQNIAAMLIKDDLYKNIYKFPPREFAIALKWLNKQNIQFPLKKVIGKLNELKIDDIKRDKNPINLLTEFIKVFEDEQDILEKISDKFSELLSEDFVLYSNFKEIINSEVIKHLLNDKFAMNIIQTMQQNYNQSYTKEKVEIIRALNKYGTLSKERKIQYLNSAISFIEQLRSHQNWDIFSFWLEAISGFFEETTNQDTIINLYNSLSGIFDLIYSQFNYRQLGEQNIKVYRSYTNILGELYLILDDQKKQNIVSWLNRFLKPQIPIDIISHINRIYQEIIEKTNKWLFAEDIINQMVSQNDFALKIELIKTINLMIKRTSESEGLNDQQINKTLTHYFNLLSQGKQEANEWIIEICQNDFIAKKIPDHIVQMDTKMLEKSIKIIEVLADKFGFDKFYPKIKELLASSDSKVQEIGIRILYIVKNSVPFDKIYVIFNLLKEIREENLSPDTAKKLIQLENFFRNKGKKRI